MTEKSHHHPRRHLDPVVYVNEYEPWYGVLVSDEKSIERARRAAMREAGSDLPMHYLGIQVHGILNEDGRPGRRRRFHVFTDEPQGENP